jgi:beta-aspartyl-dipeptidase (metallo-type)
LRRGGNIDLTAGETVGYSIAEALSILKDQGLNFNRVTASSDGNGSSPADSGISRMNQLLKDLQACIIEHQLAFPTVINIATVNPAKILKLYPRKGCLLPGSDADILVLTKDDLKINHLLARGKILIKEQKAMVKGKFEK